MSVADLLFPEIMEAFRNHPGMATAIEDGTPTGTPGVTLVVMVPEPLYGAEHLDYEVGRIPIPFEGRAEAEAYLAEVKAAASRRRECP
jgi:hypothetical protein